MADRTIYINTTTRRRVNLAGAVDLTAVELRFEALEDWTYQFRTSALVGTDMSEAVTWTAALAPDLTIATDPWLRIVNADIDSTNANVGTLVVTVDSDFAAFRQGTDGLRFQQTFFKIRGFDANDKEVHSFMLPVMAIGNVDATGGEPATNDEYYNKVTSDARFAHILASATEDNIVTFDSDGDIQDGGVSISDVAGVVESAVVTQTTCPDNVSTSILLGALPTYRYFNVLFSLDDGTNFVKYDYAVGHNGSATQNDGGDALVIAGTYFSGVTVSFSVVSTNVYLVLTLSGIGSALKCVSKIADKLPIST